MRRRSSYAFEFTATRWLWIVAAAITVLLATLALWLTTPLPPRTVVMATGAPGGAYSAVGERYREIFAHNGVQLELRPTNGSVENVELLNDPRSGVSIALVQSGTTTETQSPQLVSLGALFYEPFWLFRRTAPSGAARLRMSLGTPGSGTYLVAHQVMAATGVDLRRAEVRDLTAVEAGEAMLRGELDYIAMALAPEVPIVLKLLRDPAVRPLNWGLADAYVALHPSLSKVIVPRGLADLEKVRPAEDLALLAAKASLVVREDLHPALQYLLLEAASDIHSQAGLLHRPGQFPAAEPIDLPLSDLARQYYSGGRPFLQRYLPFWMAAFSARLLVLLIPVIGIAYPLFRLLPALYGWFMRNRIFRLYGELKFLEAEFDSDETGASRHALMERLDRLEEHADGIRVPVAFAQLLYTLKLHMDLVRQRMRERQAGAQEK